MLYIRHIELEKILYNILLYTKLDCVPSHEIRCWIDHLCQQFDIQNASDFEEFFILLFQINDFSLYIWDFKCKLIGHPPEYHCDSFFNFFNILTIIFHFPFGAPLYKHTHKKNYGITWTLLRCTFLSQVKVV